MGLVEAKKLSDVVIDSTRFEKLIVKSQAIAPNEYILLAGSGIVKALFYNSTASPDWYTGCVVDGTYIDIRTIVVNEPSSSMIVVSVPFSKSIQFINNASSGNTDIRLVAFLHNNISIGGGDSRVVSFNCRKAVAA